MRVCWNWWNKPREAEPECLILGRRTPNQESTQDCVDRVASLYLHRRATDYGDTRLVK